MKKVHRRRRTCPSIGYITSFTLPYEIKDVLNEAAHAARLSKSEFVRAAIVEKAERLTTTPAERTA